MFPVAEIRPSYLAGVCGLAVLLPFEHHDQSFIVSADDPSMGIFLDGTYAFHSFPIAQSENWKGAAIEGVELLVDLESSYSPSRQGVVLGSLVRSGDRISIVAKVRDGHGFHDTVEIPLQHALPEGGDRLRTGYVRWSIIKRLGQNYTVVHETTVERTT